MVLIQLLFGLGKLGMEAILMIAVVLLIVARVLKAKASHGY
jgi:hypothetical protein